MSKVDNIIVIVIVVVGVLGLLYNSYSVSNYVQESVGLGPENDDCDGRYSYRLCDNKHFGCTKLSQACSSYNCGTFNFGCLAEMRQVCKFAGEACADAAHCYRCLVKELGEGQDFVFEEDA